MGIELWIALATIIMSVISSVVVVTRYTSGIENSIDKVKFETEGELKSMRGTLINHNSDLRRVEERIVRHKDELKYMIESEEGRNEKRDEVLNKKIDRFDQKLDSLKELIIKNLQK